MFSISVISDGNISIEHYQNILNDKRQLDLLGNSLLLSFGTAIISCLLGVPVAFFIERTNIWLRKYFKFLYLCPLLIFPYIHAIVWIILLGNRGTINLFFMNLFRRSESLFSIYGLGAAIMVLSFSYFPFATLLSISGLKSLDHNLEDAARLSHNEISVFKKITLPLLLPNIISAAIFIFIFSISNYSVPALLRVNTYPIEIFMQFSAFYNTKEATASSLPLIFIVFILVLLQRYYMKDRPYVAIINTSKESSLINLNNYRIFAFIFVAFIIFITVFLPIIVLLINSESFLSYKMALRTSYREILTTFSLSIIAATIIVFLSFFIAYLMERAKRFNAILDIFSLLPFAIPATILGIGLIMVWNHPSTSFIYGTFLIMLFAYIGRFVPFAIRAISSNIKQIDLQLEEAALITQPSYTKRILNILIPLIKPGLLSAWIIVFVLCTGELDTTLLVIPAGNSTLPLKIYTLLHYGANKLVSALSIILVFITLGVIFLLIHLIDRQKRFQIQ